MTATTSFSLGALSRNLPSTSATFQYIQDSPRFQTENPYFYQGPLEPDEELSRTNVTFEAHSNVLVRDLRSVQKLVSLNDHGFELLRHPSLLIHNLDEAGILDQYLQETNNMLERELNADVVICYDVKFRKSRSTSAEIVYYDKSAVGRGGKPDDPAWQAHIDSTYEGGELRVRRHLTDSEAKEFFNGNWRVRIINVWRPLHRTVKQAPLAFCDRTSVKTSDLFAVERPSLKRIGYVSFLKYSPDQQWYWFSNQTPEEVTVFLSWDSDAENATMFMPHASFLFPDGSLPQRESIETRAIVVTRKD